MTYAPHERLVAPARRHPEVWRLLAGIALAAAIYVVLLQLLFAGIVAAAGADAGWLLAAEIAAGDTPRGALIVLLSFAFMAVSAAIAARALHRRGWATLIGPWPVARRDFVATCRALFILAAVLWVLLPGGEEISRVRPLTGWLILLPLSVVAILVQSAAEEIAFRGYVQSQVAARWPKPAVWLILPSALFAIGHYTPQEAGGNAAWFVAWAFVFGLAAADLTARTGTLGAAVAFHFVNNFLAIALVALPGPFSGLALYLYPFPADDVAALRPLLWLDLAAIGLSWLAARVALRV